MKLDRLPHDPGALVDFYQEALEHLGAVCERSWYDRLQLVAEGAAARLWNADGALHEAELHFPAPDATAPRDAVREVFPGCPLTFHLVETLRPQPLALERVVLEADQRSGPPSPDVAEKLWHAQRPGVSRWRMASDFQPVHHFSLLVLARCEIQAIDQHWSLHRIALTLPHGERDESLATGWDLIELAPAPAEPIPWPALEPAHWNHLLNAALEEELAGELDPIRARQENYLRRELDRVDDYFANYEQELTARAARSANAVTKQKTADRMAAARAEHARRRQDQVQRHELRVVPHLDALLLVAEPAWQTTVAVTRPGETSSQTARFVPRSRRWYEVASLGES